MLAAGVAMNILAPSLSFRGMPRFQLVRKLGEGGMGVVHEVFDRERNAHVALKTLQLLTTERLMRFKHEFRALQDLRHPNLVGLDELLESDGVWFFTMELVRGANFRLHVRPGTTWPPPSEPTPGGLADLSHTQDTVDIPGLAMSAPPARPGAPLSASPVEDEATPRFDEERLRDGLRQLVRGLSALHEAGMVHRDIKPGNVLVTPAGRVVILDFGLVADASPARTNLGVVGTLGYMAPEQTSGAPVGPAADWYSVGVMLFEALTGRLPFLGTPDDILAQKQHAEPPPPREIIADVPADLDALCVELLRRDPALRPAGAEIGGRLSAHEQRVSAAVPARGTLFVGRTGELELLDAALADARAGQAVALLVHGDSGVGKSALLRHFLDAAAADPRTLVLAGRCYERESVPYKAVDQAISALGHHLGRLPPERLVELLPERIDRVANIFPVFRELRRAESTGAPAALAEPTTSDAFQVRAQMFATLRELWTRLGSERTLVLAIDDMQWADLDSLALLSELVRPPAAPPMLLCATVRTSAGAGARTVASLRARLGDSVREVHVGRLPAADARELVARLLSSVAASGQDAASVAAIADGGEGHPLFIDALVRHRLLHPDAEGSVRPMGLDDALLERAASVGPAAAALLDFVCIAGAPIQQEACASAAGTPFGEFVHLVAVLRAANLVKTHGIHRGDSLEPYHDRVREAVVAQLVPAARRKLHGSLARALEQSGQGDPETLAVHFQESGDASKAARYATRAAERAQAALAFDRAARLYRLALDLEPDGAPVEAQRLRLGLAEALSNSGRGNDAALVYLESARHASADEQLELKRLAAGQFFRAGRLEEGVDTMRPMLTRFGMPMPTTRARAIWSFLYQRLRLRLHGLKLARHDQAQVPPELLQRMDACSAMYPFGMTDALRGLPFQARLVRLSLEAGVPARVVQALSAEIVFRSTRGEKSAPTVERLHAFAMKMCEQTSGPYFPAVIEAATGTAECLQGRWKLSYQRCEASERVLREQCTGAAWELGTTQVYGARSLFFLGELAELRRRLMNALKDASERGDQYLSTSLRLGIPMAHIWIAQDDPATAQRHSSEAMQAWTYPGTHIQHVLQFHGELAIDLYNGDVEAAQRRIDETWPRLDKARYLRMQYSRIVSLHLRARVALAAALRSQGKPREQQLARAARDAARIARERTRWGDPLAASLDAGVAACRDEVPRATALLDAAELGFARADMRLFAAAARRQRGRIASQGGGQAIATADAFMREQGIVRCDRFAELLVPGFVAPSGS